MFLAPSIFGGALPEFLDLDYEVEPDTDHVTKFRDDRPMDLGDWALNKKTSPAEHKPVRNGGSGRPKNRSIFDALMTETYFLAHSAEIQHTMQGLYDPSRTTR